MLEDYVPGNSGPNFHWQCERRDCKLKIVAWSNPGLTALRREHEAWHGRLDDAITESRRQRFETLAAIRNYDYLELSWYDITFLKTRGIAIDENINYNKYMKHDPCYDTEPKNWRRILELAWPLENK